ncbi:hypothetical protein ScPMuIL_016128 [Solemya velum]
MVNTPIPHSLKSEAKKAAKILRDFTVPSAKTGPDKLIPAGILLKAKGLAILTVFKAGFLVTARAGSGIVIAKLGDDDNDGFERSWSAPSAIGIAGLGGGFEIGAEVTDFVIILNSRKALDAFSKGGNLTLGGNFTIAAGPLGRNLEGDIAVRSPAAIYTYSKTRGIFAGISVEGSALIERKDANKKFYGSEIRAFQILSGEVDPPEECAALYEVLDSHQTRAEQAVVDIAKRHASKHASKHASSVSDRISSTFHKPSFSFKSKDSNSDSTNKGSSKETTTVRRSTTTVRSAHSYSRTGQQAFHRTVTTHTTADMAATPSSRKSLDDFDLSTLCRTVAGSAEDLRAHVMRAVAIHPYAAQMPCDLSFKSGDEIIVLTKTDTEDDWWEGHCNGKTGIFPANYARLD